MMLTTRRQFLQTSTAAALLTLGAHGLRAAENPAATGMKLGLVTYQWGKDWDIPTIIKNCAAANFSGVELRTTHAHGVDLPLTKEQRAEVRKQFADSPVEVVGIGSACEYHSADPKVLRKNIEETKAYLQLSHDLGGTGVKVRPNGFVKDVPHEKTIEQIGKSLNEVSEFAAGLGQEIRLEVHGKETAEIPVMVEIMKVATHPLARVCWNCNPQDLKGDGLAANFAALQSRIATVHIHDLTTNSYPWQELFALLKGINFQGWTLLEENRMPVNIPAAMDENYKVWKELTAR